ncbi:unnamed protein product [Trichogramma brassicae]|uniref:Uncharacterized protein n=1 Tax=Trichogramma brassicae TaxID=86971 RepID=A0A6H5I8D9_9HYME|nr:unnamed protein product [Trichogramma brassicae]
MFVRIAERIRQSWNVCSIQYYGDDVLRGLASGSGDEKEKNTTTSLHLLLLLLLQESREKRKIIYVFDRKTKCPCDEWRDIINISLNPDKHVEYIRKDKTKQSSLHWDTCGAASRRLDADDSRRSLDDRPGQKARSNNIDSKSSSCSECRRVIIFVPKHIINSHIARSMCAAGVRQCHAGSLVPHPGAAQAPGHSQPGGSQGSLAALLGKEAGRPARVRQVHDVRRELHGDRGVVAGPGLRQRHGGPQPGRLRRHRRRESLDDGQLDGGPLQPRRPRRLQSDLAAALPAQAATAARRQS